MLSATLSKGLAVDDLPNRASDRAVLPFGDCDRDRMPDKVLDLDVKDGLAGRNARLGVDAAVSGDPSGGDLVFRTSSEGTEV